MSDFKAKMHQIQFRLGLRPRPRWGTLQRSPVHLAGFKGPTSKGGERERRGRGKGKGGERRGRGKGEGGEKEGERKRELRDPQGLVDIPMFLKKYPAYV